MDFKNIKKLIAKGESNTLEFKKSTAQLKPACETICGFLNSDGGIILIGVTDNQKIVGQEVSDKTKREVGNELAKISPIATVEIDYIRLDTSNKVLIVLHVHTDSTKKPYTYDGRSFLRVQSNTLRMPIEYYRQLTLNNANQNYNWEQLVIPNVTIDDLDTDEILTSVKEGTINGRIPKSFATKDPEVALQRLGLLEDKKITNAALILFGKLPQKIYPQCLLRLARFKGTTKTEFIDNKQISGSLFFLLETAIAFAHTHLPIASTFSNTDIKRKDKPLVPTLALREALVNALCHRDYSNYSGSVSFAIFDDRVEIWNYGLLPSGVTAENLKNLHCSIPRNRKIANVLYYHQIFESWGRGIELIISECQKYGLPSPFYTENEVGTLLTIPLIEIPKEFPPKHQAITKLQQKILSALKNKNSLSTNEIRDCINDPPSERWLRTELNTLKELGYIDVSGKTASRKWFIKN